MFDFLPSIILNTLPSLQLFFCSFLFTIPFCDFPNCHYTYSYTDLSLHICYCICPYMFVLISTLLQICLCRFTLVSVFVQIYLYAFANLSCNPSECKLYCKLCLQSTHSQTLSYNFTCILILVENHCMIYFQPFDKSLLINLLLYNRLLTNPQLFSYTLSFIFSY